MNSEGTSNIHTDMPTTNKEDEVHSSSVDAKDPDFPTLQMLLGGNTTSLKAGEVKVSTFKPLKLCQDNGGAYDPFLRFSSDKRRLEYLLGRALPSMPVDQEPIERKRRISFELDPLHDKLNSYPELLFDESFEDETDDDILNSFVDLVGERINEENDSGSVGDVN